MSTATGVLVPLMLAHGGKKAGPQKGANPCASTQNLRQNEARGVSSLPIGTASESLDCIRQSNLFFSVGTTSRTSADETDVQSDIAGDRTFVEPFLQHIG